MSVYKIPLKWKAGEYKFDELHIDDTNKCLELDYDENHQMLTYNVPMYENAARIYTVPNNLIPNGLTAVYGDSGELEKVELTEAQCTRLIYIWFKNIKASEKGVLKFVKEQADKMSAEIIRKKQKLARLFLGTFYDGEAVEIAIKTATEEEVKTVIDKYDGNPNTADNSGNYPAGNLIMLDDEPLAVMLMCTNCDFQNMLFGLAVSAVEKRIKSRILNKVDMTDDFRLILEEGD